MWKKKQRHLGWSSDDNSNGALSADADRADFLARLLVPLALPSYNFIPRKYYYVKHQKQLDLNISMVKCTHSS